MLKQVYLRPMDVFVLCKIVSLEDPRTAQAELARSLLVNPAQITESLQRSATCHLFNAKRRVVVVRAFTEFLQHGIKYAFPWTKGSETRGIPTADAAPPLRHQLTQHLVPPVWASPLGTIRGVEIAPLHPTAPKVVLNDSSFYEVLALVDTMRNIRARESDLAWGELRLRLDKYESKIG